MASLSKFGKLDSARTHEQCRAIVCCCCGKKVKVNKKDGTVNIVSEKMSCLVRKYVYEGYSEHNTAHPTAMCVTCRLALTDLGKVSLIGILI